MRELMVNAFVTLDGVMQAPGGPEEDPSGGFAHGGGSVNYWDDVMNQKMGASMGEPFDLPLGRKTYEIFAAHWPHVSDEEREARGGNASDIDDPATAALNEARKYVASTTLGEVTWNNSTLLRGDVAERVAALKAGAARTSRYEPAGAIDYGSFAFAEPTDEEVARRRSLDDE